VCLLLLGAGCLPAQHQVTLSVGWGEQISFYPTDRRTAPVLGASYGYRPRKWLQVEAGVLTALQPGQTLCNAHDCFNPDDRYLWVPLGVRFVAPWKRVELSAGGGGLYELYSVSNGGSSISFSPYHYNAWGGYFVGGAAVKVTRHFWVGATPRFPLANRTHIRDHWFTITGDVSFRF